MADLSKIIEPINPNENFDEEKFLKGYELLAMLQGSSLDKNPGEIAQFLGQINTGNPFMYMNATPEELKVAKEETTRHHQTAMGNYSIKNLETIVGELPNEMLLQVIFKIPARTESGFNEETVSAVKTYQENAEKASEDGRAFYDETIARLPETSREIIAKYDPQKVVQATVYGLQYEAQSKFLENTDESENKNTLDKRRLINYTKSHLDYWKEQEDSQEKHEVYGVVQGIAEMCYRKKKEEAKQSEDNPNGKE